MFNIGFVANAQKSYGFVYPLLNNILGTDRFFHFSKVDKQLLAENNKPTLGGYRVLQETLPGKFVVFNTSQSGDVEYLNLVSNVILEKESDAYRDFIRVLKELIDKGITTLYIGSYIDKKDNEHYELRGENRANIRINFRLYTEGKEYYVKDVLNEKIDDPAAWFEYMKFYDPDNNVFELFIERFFDILCVENFDGPIWEGMLKSYGFKFQPQKDKETIHKTYPYESRQEVQDNYASLRDYGRLWYGGDIYKNYQMECPVIHATFDKYTDIGNGVLTSSNMAKAMTYPESAIEITWPWSIHTPTEMREESDRLREMRSINALLEGYVKDKSACLQSPSVESALILLRLTDAYTRRLRVVITELSHRRPTEEERQKNNRVVEKHGWQKAD